jgi:carboxyl-terminal processing protease
MSEFSEQQKVKKRNSKILIGAIIFLVFLFGWACGHLDAQRQMKGYIPGISVQKNQAGFDIFWNAWDKITQNYDGKVDYNKLIYGAVDGMVKAVGDPYTMFLDSEQAKKFNEDLEGSISGIGAEIGIKDDRVIIVAPIGGSPAQKAGLMPQDIILKIGDTDTKGMDLSTAVSKIRGDVGTKVKLTIQRGDKTRTYEITREKIEIKSVRWEVKSGNVGYIEISRFDSKTKNLLKEAIEDLKDKQVKAVVLDLRNNPGGYLDTAVDVGSEFIKKGLVIVTEKRETGSGKREDYRSSGKSKLTDSNIPMVVLVNEGSASASEIVAGALQDYHRAILIGEKTFGKGSVQSIENLGQGATLHITVAHWYTPNGKNIGKEGLRPDITVKLTEEDAKNNRDPQLDRALLELKNRITK